MIVSLLGGCSRGGAGSRVSGANSAAVALTHTTVSIASDSATPPESSSTVVPTSPAPIAALGAVTVTGSGARAQNLSPVRDLSPEILPLIAAVPAHVGMVIALPGDTTDFEYNADTVFESASLYKLGIMVEVYRQRDAGELSFDDLVTLYPGFFVEDDSVYGYDNVYDQVPVGTLLSNMITLSSNVAATALLDLVGTDHVNATMQSLGLTRTKILWYPSGQINAPAPAAPASFVLQQGRNAAVVQSFGNGHPLMPAHTDVDGAYNVTTPADVARLFQELVDGSVVSPQSSAEMLGLLSRQEINDRLPASLPSGTRVAHKTGDLDYSVHDAGVIFAPGGPIVVVVLSDEVEDRQSVVDLIRTVALLAYRARTP